MFVVNNMILSVYYKIVNKVIICYNGHKRFFVRKGDVMLNSFSRTELLLGEEAMKKLQKSRVAVFGIGGVGGYTVEALVRSGIGTIDIIDNDRVSLTNINRQIYATHSTIGKYKVDVAVERIKDINPDVVVNVHRTFYTPETSGDFDFSQYDYVVDAIDTVSGKIELVMQAEKTSTPIICSMGAGNKLDPTAFVVSDIYKTSVCPLARVMRNAMRKRGVKKLKVVYSKEQPVEQKTVIDMSGETSINKKRQIPGSISFVPSVVGLIIAGEVIKDIANKK